MMRKIHTRTLSSGGVRSRVLCSFNVDYIHKCAGLFINFVLRFHHHLNISSCKTKPPSDTAIHNNISTMADSLPKLGVMLQSARELTLEAANAVSAKLMNENLSKPADITKALNSLSNREKLSGLKQVISHMSKGYDAVEFFPSVIKNVASSSLEIRMLVYIYLVRYADHDPDLALLSINAIQKSLSDKNAVIRSLAMRVISSIRVPSIVQIVCLGIKKSSTDLSPLVRRAAAVAIHKCNELDHSNSEMLLEILQKLLGDSSPEVVSSALITLSQSFTNRFDLLHPVYRRTCRMLPKLNEWGQIAALELLVKYARLFLRPGSLQPVKKEQADDLEAFIGDDTQQYESFDDEDDFDENNESRDHTSSDSPSISIDPDLELLFISARPLLYSRNSAVIINAAQVYHHLGNSKVFEAYQVAGPVVQLLRSDISLQYLALINIKAMSLTRRDAFAPFIRHFFLFPDDIFLISKLKLEILTLLCTKDNAQTIVSELKYYALTSNNDSIIVESVQAVGRCIDVAENTSILKWLLHKVKSSNPALVSESLNVVRFIVLKDPNSHIKTVARLAQLLDKVVVDSAKETIIWLVGEFSGIAHEVAPDVLRKFAKTFASESPNVRYQTTLLAAKVFSYYLDRNKSDDPNDFVPIDNGPESSIPKLFSYVMLLAKYDTNYDTRDRARLFSTLLTSSASTDLATLLLQAPKPCPVTSLREIMLGSKKKNISNSTENTVITTTTPIVDLILGSTSLVLGHPVDGFQRLPNWTKKDSPLRADPSVRDEIVSRPTTQPVRSISNVTSAASAARSRQSGATAFGSNCNPPIPAAPKKFKEQTLDEFFADAGENEEESSSEEDSSSEEESSSGDEEDDDEDDEDSDEDGEREEEESEEEDNNEEEDNSEEEESEEENEQDEKATLLVK